MDTHTEIPNGLYCYELLSVEQRENLPPITHIKLCPYFTWSEDVLGYCKLLGVEIDDQCKACAINDDLNDE